MVLRLCLVFNLLLITVGYPSGFASEQPKARQGVINLQQWDFAARGTVTIEGFGHEADTLHIEFQNEFLIAYLNGKVEVTVPDLICIVTEEEGQPVATERLQYGMRVAVLGVPAPPQLKTERALREMPGRQ